MPVEAKPAIKSRKSASKAGKRTARAALKSVSKKQYTTNVGDLYDFTTSFFAVLGGTVKRVDRRKYGPLQVTLAGELATYFDTETLALAFHQAEPVPGEALVAHGSPIFDKMINYLERKSAVTVQQLPIRHGAGEELLQAIRPTNAGIVNLRTIQEAQQLFAFQWRITYRADDKREELYTVILNTEGERLVQPDEATIQSANGVPALDIDTLLADAKASPQPQATTDPLPAPKLPPMTHLVRLAETARKYAVYHADVRCVSHEAEILPRLYKTLNRLSTYYQQQIEEVYESHDPDGAKRRSLELDLERKLAEEVENHRLRVQLELVNYAVLQMPITVVHMTLSDGVREVDVTVERNRYSGLLQRPTCHACGKEAMTIAIDRNSHITCDDCVQQCGTCQDILCAECGVEPCPLCGKTNCDTCGQLCWACGERACSDHISTCPTCGDAVCHACQVACVACGVRQCRSHLRVDHVRSQQGETAFVCGSCAIRCPSCEQYSAEIATCEMSGQRFCQSCLVTCRRCHKTVGPGFYEDFDEIPYCHSCLLECPSCHRWALETIGCPTCGAPYCAACEAACAFCETSYCLEHSHYIATCDHTICHGHIVSCTVCADEVCPICNEVCAICEGYYCTKHIARCERCGQNYCHSCVHTTGFCSTCAALDSDTDIAAVDLLLEPCANDPRVVKLASHYNWILASNHRYKIYWGQNSLGRTALIVTTYDANDERVITVRGRGTTTRKQATAKQQNVEEKDPHEWMSEFQDWLRRMRRRRGR